MKNRESADMVASLTAQASRFTAISVTTPTVATGAPATAREAADSFAISAEPSSRWAPHAPTDRLPGGRRGLGLCQVPVSDRR